MDEQGVVEIFTIVKTMVILNPLYSGNPQTSNFANSEDSDEMLQFIRVLTFAEVKKSSGT